MEFAAFDQRFDRSGDLWKLQVYDGENWHDQGPSLSHEQLEKLAEGFSDDYMRHLYGLHADGSLAEYVTVHQWVAMARKALSAA